MAEEASPYAEMAQRNSVLSAGLFEARTSTSCKWYRPKDLPKDASCSRGRAGSSSPTKTHSTVATRTDMHPLLFPASSKSTLRGRSRSSSCPKRALQQARRGRARSIHAGKRADALREEHAPASATCQPGGNGNDADSYCGWASSPYSNLSLDSLLSHSCALASTVSSSEEPDRGPSPVPAVQCGTPEGRSSSPAPPRRDQQGISADGHQAAPADDLDAIVKQHPLMGRPKCLSKKGHTSALASKMDQLATSKQCDSTDSSTEESTRLSSEASSPERRAPRSRRTSQSHVANPLLGGLASGLSENNPLLGGLEWDSKPDFAQLALLDRVLGGSARQVPEAGPPLLPANFLEGRRGAPMHTSLSAMEASSTSPRKQRLRSDGKLSAGLLSPSTIVQVKSSSAQGGAREEATILLVDHVKGAYKIRTLDGHTKTVQASEVSASSPCAS